MPGLSGGRNQIDTLFEWCFEWPGGGFEVASSWRSAVPSLHNFLKQGLICFVRMLQLKERFPFLIPKHIYVVSDEGIQRSANVVIRAALEMMDGVDEALKDHRGFRQYFFKGRYRNP